MYTYKFFLTNPDLSLFQDILQKVQNSNFLVIQMANIWTKSRILDALTTLFKAYSELGLGQQIQAHLELAVG